MKIRALDMPNAIINMRVPVKAGTHQPSVRRKAATPAAPKGTSPYST
ncbi:MAG: hypothetical protein QM757_35355 [Paludibaculum sp.]